MPLEEPHRLPRSHDDEKVHEEQRQEKIEHHVFRNTDKVTI